MKSIEKYEKWLKKNNIPYEFLNYEKLNNLVDLVWEWNKKINITASKSKEEVLTRHVLDSLTALTFLDNEEINIIDIGSGGGFPALPLAISLPNTNFTLVERVPKKCAFLNRVKRKLNLENITVINSDLKDLNLDFNVTKATTRAVRVDEEFLIYLRNLNIKQLITFSSEIEKNSKYNSYTLPGESKQRYINLTII